MSSNILIFVIDIKFMRAIIFCGGYCPKFVAAFYRHNAVSSINGDLIFTRNKDMTSTLKVKRCPIWGRIYSFSPPICNDSNVWNSSANAKIFSIV